MSEKKIMPETVQDICNRQIDISLKVEVNIQNAIPLKKLVGYAAYNGNGYSKDYEPLLFTKEQLDKVNPVRSFREIEKR